MTRRIGRVVSGVFFLTLFQTLFSEILCQSEASTKTDFCSNPKEAENFDYEWLKSQASFHKAWNIQVGNSVTRDHITKYLKETELTNKNELEELCAKDLLDSLDDEHIIGRFQGFGDQISHWNCSLAQNNSACLFSSVNNVYKETGNFYLTYLDGIQDHNLIGFVLCFQSGDVGWYASTVSESITDEETQTALKHFKSLGFDTDSYVKLQSPACKKSS